MKSVFVIISSLISIASTIPYILDTIKLKTKPRVVSWFTWAVLGAIAGSAALSDHQYPAAIFCFISGLLCAVIFMLGLYYDGEKSFSKFDAVCQLAAIAGLVLWYIFNSPSIAIIAAIFIDLIASLPTLKHSWQKPFEETVAAYAFYVVAALFTILAVTDYKVTSLASPLYIFILNSCITGVLLIRRRPLTAVKKSTP